MTWFYGLVSPTLTQIALVLSTVGGLQVMITLSALLILGLWFKSHRESVFFCCEHDWRVGHYGFNQSCFGPPAPRALSRRELLENGLTVVSQRSRHRQRSFCPDTFFLWCGRLAPKWQGLVGVLGVLFCLSVSASRLYLQVHYPSDILAGLALGSGWVLGVNTIYTLPHPHY